MAAAGLEFVLADLTQDDGWDAAAAGCDYVLHVASPLGGEAAREPEALIVLRSSTFAILPSCTCGP